MLGYVVAGPGVIAVLLMVPATLAAQTSASPQRDLSELLPRLYQRVIDQEVDALDGFSEGVLRARVDAASQINDRLAGQLSSFPLVSSAGGFTWRFEPITATFFRTSDSFGPMFAERALTIGRNRTHVGVNVQHVTFDRLEGKALRGGEIVGYSGIPVYLSDRNDYGVFFEDRLSLQASATTVSVFATYGVSDRFDVGAAVPINRVAIDASLTSVYGNSVDGVNPLTSVPGCNPPPLPTQCTPVPAPIAEESSGTAMGLGDVVVRAKYHFLEGLGGGLAGAVDVRLPTGDERNLLGIGGGQVKMYLIASTERSRLSPHVNIGYTVSGESAASKDVNSFVIAPADEINYAAGADIVVWSRTTVIFDILGRTLRGIGGLEEGPTRFIAPQGGRYQELQLIPGADVNLLLGSSGVRFNPGANMLVSLNVLFPLSEGGLTDRLTWLVGADYSF